MRTCGSAIVYAIRLESTFVVNGQTGALVKVSDGETDAESKTLDLYGIKKRTR